MPDRGGERFPYSNLVTVRGSGGMRRRLGERFRESRPVIDMSRPPEEVEVAQ